MVATTGIIQQPRLRARTAAVAMTATFAVGLLAGLSAPRIGLPSGGTQATVVGAAAVDMASQAYQDYRRGERDFLVATEPATVKAWLTYRAGERGDPAAP
jgi:hypothetical protein